jgi:arylsulfatase A-like enzyme
MSQLYVDFSAVSRPGRDRISREASTQPGEGRMFDRITLSITLSLWTAMSGAASAADAGSPPRPNIVLIMTDDQGFGDLGRHGNPVIRTPHLDRFAAQSAWMRNFHVSPVCAPTRASLLTGRYNYRTAAVDTYRGRAMMRPDEVTLAEMLLAAGYRTGIFGKWHLGDNYPLRAIDQGFQQALVHQGGGIGQPADPPGNSYFDPVLQRNGQPQPSQGYCSDTFTTAAIDFIRDQQADPFFVYLAFNCPHDPLEVRPEDLAGYAGRDLSPAAFPAIGQPLPEQANQEAIARVYGMVTNIDDNVGRLLTALDELRLTENTIVVFLTDNGPAQPRYNGGLRDRKGSVYDGGIRVPCYVRWPGHIAPQHVIDTPAAHIDLTPTLLAACGVEPPEGVAFDGRSLLPQWLGQPVDWPDRTLYFQWHRGDVPEMGRAFAARGPRYKLVQSRGVPEGPWAGPPVYELFDMPADPFEQHDLASEHPQIVAAMRAEYEAWFADVSRDGFDPPRIALGTPHENPVTLTRQDWRGPDAGWTNAGLGHWQVEVKAGRYDLRLRFAPIEADTPVTFRLGDVRLEAIAPAGATEWTFPGVALPAGPARLEAWLSPPGGKDVGVLYVDVTLGE